MREVPVTLKALKVTGHMCPMVDLVARVLGSEVFHLVTFLAGPGVHLATQNRATVTARESYRNIPGPVQMRPELSYDARFRMTTDTIGFLMDRP